MKSFLSDTHGNRIMLGHIQPTPETEALWDDLKAAKANNNYVEIGRLSAEIRKQTVRNAEESPERTPYPIVIEGFIEAANGNR